MSRTTRSIGRGAAAGAGALALMLGAAACTGGDQERPEEPTGAQQGAPAPDEEETSHAAGDGGGGSSTGPVEEAELVAASQRFVDALQVLDDQDWEAACGFVLDPTTGTAPEGERLQECVDGVEPALAPQADQLRPGTFDVIEPSMVEASDNGDGTVSLSVLGEDIDIPMVRGVDGAWYLSIPF